jgi:hypothetical protein
MQSHPAFAPESLGHFCGKDCYASPDKRGCLEGKGSNIDLVLASCKPEGKRGVTD